MTKKIQLALALLACPDLLRIDTPTLARDLSRAYGVTDYMAREAIAEARHNMGVYAPMHEQFPRAA